MRATSSWRDPGRPPRGPAFPEGMAVPDIVRTAYVELVVTDLAEARRFWVDLLGFVVAREEPGALYLRGFEEMVHHSLVLRQGASPACARLAFRVRTHEDLDKGRRLFEALGCPTERVPAGTVAGVGEALRAEDPLGFTIELFRDMDRVEPLHQRYDLRRGAEVGRIDHLNIVVPDVVAAYDYYRALGFGCSETIEDDQVLYAAWMFRKQTVHDVAFTMGAGPRFHHAGFFTPESQHVLRLCDILGALHLEDRIERGPGRHGVSNAFYVYLRDPDGHRMELYTSDYFTGDPDHETIRWDVHDPRRRDFWGGPVIESWYTEASPVLDLAGDERRLTEPGATTEPAVVVGADGLGTHSRPR